MPTEKISAAEYRRRLAAGELDDPRPAPVHTVLGRDSSANRPNHSSPRAHHAPVVELFSSSASLSVLSAQSAVERPNKYHAQPTTIDGHTFASKLEAERYLVLVEAQRRGEITALGIQPRYTLLLPFVAQGKRYREMTCLMDFKYNVMVKRTGPSEPEENISIVAAQVPGDRIGYARRVLPVLYTVVEDTKGKDNPVSILKRKIFLHTYCAKQPGAGIAPLLHFRLVHSATDPVGLHP